MRSGMQGPGFLVSTVAMLLAACGGGGGGDGGDGGGDGSGPGLTVSTTSVEAAADAGTPSTPEASFTITVTDAPASGVAIGGNFTQNGISDVTLNPTSGSNGVVTIFFQDPSIIGPGVFEDTVQLGICTNQSCGAIRAGTLRTVSVEYTVTGTPPSVTASTHVVDAQGTPYTIEVPLSTVSLVLQGVSPSEVNIDTQFTENGLNYASATPDGTGGLEVQLSFQSPTALGFGTYDDTVTVNICAIVSCPSGLRGSPVVIRTHYTVSATVSGSNGYTVREVALTATDIAWDAVGGMIYVSTPGSAPQYGNSIVALDPASGTVGTSMFLGNDPSFQGISGDGQFLYVGFAGESTIRRLALPSLTPGITIDLGSYASGPLFAGDIQVFPGEPNSVAVARSVVGGLPSGYDVAVFDDENQRPNALHRDDAYFTSTQFGATNDVLYGGDGVISIMTVDDDGVSLSDSVDFSVNLGPARVYFSDGVLYTDRGLAIDPVAKTMLGTYAMAANEFGKAAAPDAGLNRIFFLIQGPPGYYVRSYELGTFAPIAEIPMYGLQFPPKRPLRMIRWGADGLAVSTADGRVIVITGPFVKP